MARNFQQLWKEVINAIDEAAAVLALVKILIDREGRAFALGLSPEDAEHCIDILDRGIQGGNLKTTVEKQAFFVTLRRLAGLHGRLPGSMIIAQNFQVGNDILASGGFADIKLGTYAGHVVAVKTLRIAKADDIQKTKKQFCKEVVLWSTLAHPHVLKLIGVYGEMDKGEFITVSEWMMHGNIMEYIKKNHANRLQLLHGAAQGLKYIHNVGLTHGDLKGANILMSNDTPPRACLADFGFMTMVLDPQQPMSCSAQLEGGTLAFMPPELLVPTEFDITNPVPTPEADVYAFGLVILQVLTGELPFPGIRITELGFSVFQGLRPPRPANALAIGFSEELWAFVQRCWDGNMNSRPMVAEVVNQLARAAASWHGLMPPCPQVEIVPCVSEATLWDTMDNCRMFDPPSAAHESPSDSRTTPSLFSSPGSPSTAHTESPQEEPLRAIAKLPAEPLRNRRVDVPQRPQELPDNLPVFQHMPHNSRTSHQRFSHPGSPSAAYTEPPQEEPLRTTARLPTELPRNRRVNVPQRPQEMPDDLQEFQRMPYNSRTPHERFNFPGSSSTAYTKPPQEQPLRTTARLPTEPLRDRRVNVSQQQQELPEDLREFQHVAHGFRPPPSTVPPPKPKPFRRFGAKLREIFGFLRSHHH